MITNDKSNEDRRVVCDFFRSLLEAVVGRLSPGLQLQRSFFPRHLESVWVFFIVSLHHFHPVNADSGSNCEFGAHQAESGYTIQQHVVELQRDRIKMNEQEDNKIKV